MGIHTSQNVALPNRLRLNRGSHFTPFKKSVLLNKEVIAVNQDKLGRQGTRLAFWDCPDGAEGQLTCQVWGKSLVEGAQAIVLLNKDIRSRSITVDFSLVGWPTQRVSVRDLWAHKNLGTFTSKFTANVASHGVVMLKVTAQN